MLWVGVLFLAVSGAADMVSAAYRSTILQVAAPDNLRGRLQGVFTVVVAGGPRVGDFVAGSVASGVGERVALVLGGLACIAGVLIACAFSRRFLATTPSTPRPDPDVRSITSHSGGKDGWRTQLVGSVRRNARNALHRRRRT